MLEYYIDYGYTASLWRKMANNPLGIDFKFIATDTRPARTQHIRAVTSLSWELLQEMGVPGKNRFTKILNLYEAHKGRIT